MHIHPQQVERFEVVRGTAEHDDLDDLLARIDEVRKRDLNAIRLRRE